MDETRRDEDAAVIADETPVLGVQESSCVSQETSVMINQCNKEADLQVVDKPVRSIREKAASRRRAKGSGGLQLEKTGIWTLRCLINGKRVAKSTGTRDRAEAEKFAKRFLAPYVKDDPTRTYLNIQAAVMTERQLAEMKEDENPQMKISEAWEAYENSSMRRELAKTTLDGKKQVFRSFAEYIAKTFPELQELRNTTRDHAESYLAYLREGHSSTTYNNRLCVLREMYRVLSKKARIKENPWEGFPMRADDSHTRRELTVEELGRLISKAGDEGFEWKLLFAIGMYTGLRLGDCCKLLWSEVDIVRSIIQKIPEKTKKYRKGRPITVPIHQTLSQLFSQIPVHERVGYVLPTIGAWAAMGAAGMGRIHHRIGKIFRAAGIVTSVEIEGRKWKAPEATFHSLRHTFVSLSANAGVPLHIVQSIVGHESVAMTRHYYHENIGALQQAVEAIPSISETGTLSRGAVAYSEESRRISTGVEAPLVGRSAERNMIRREEKLMCVEQANQEAQQLGGWGETPAQAPLVSAPVVQVPQQELSSPIPVNSYTANARRERSEWISRCVRRWSLLKKISLLDGTTKLVGWGAYKFLQELWDKGASMVVDDAVEAVDVFLGAKGIKF